MKTYSLTHIAAEKLHHTMTALVARDCTSTAELLAHLAEFDVRGSFRPMGYPSIHHYCVEELHLSEDAAYRRITAARAARQFPALFSAVADGRLHLTAVGMLAGYLTHSTVDELIALATHKRKSELELLLAHRFPKPDVLTRIEAIAPRPGVTQVQTLPENVQELSASLVPGRVELTSQQLAPERVDPLPPAKVAPLAPQRFELQLTMTQSTHDKLRYAQELLSHQIPSGDVAQVLDRALDVLIAKLERAKFAATDQPHAPKRSGKRNARHVPSSVKRAVWKRDGGQCTFVSESGRRCSSRKFLEYDHIDEVARGGRATIDRMRLRCRAHNQFTAECTFGAGFMAEKRRIAAQSRASGSLEFAPITPSCAIVSPQSRG